MGRWLSWRVVLAGILGTACGAAVGFWLAAVLRDHSGEGMAKRKADKAFVVKEIHWEYVDRSEPLQESESGGAGFPRKVFADRAAADAFCRKLNRTAREDANPFMH